MGEWRYSATVLDIDTGWEWSNVNLKAIVAPKLN
jgi:hypothetical protein